MQQQYEDIHARAMDAVEHWDAVPAWNIYRELEKFLEALPVEQKKEPELAREVARLKRDLLAVGFPALPRNEAVKLFREHILNFFQVDVDFQERLLTRYTFVGYGEKDEERKSLQEALLQNQERLGQFTLGEWVKNFDIQFPPAKRRESVVKDFLMRAAAVASLQKEEQMILRTILSVYENFLSKEVLDEIDMAMMNVGEDTGQSAVRVVGQNASLYGRSDQQKIVNIPLLQALSKYEQLGQRVITSEKIKLKTQIELVRPSIINWLKYYRDELGIGQHSNVERGEFLFRSENGRPLSGEERERIGLILKSVEDHLPLAIDEERQEIVFPIFQGVMTDNSRQPDAVLNTMLAGPPRFARPPAVDTALQAGAPAFSSAPRPAPSAAKTFPSIAPNSSTGNMGRGAYSVPSAPIAPVRNASVAPVAGRPTNVSFSAGHIFPVEKEAEEKGTNVVKKITPQQDPYQIRPMSQGGE